MQAISNIQRENTPGSVPGSAPGKTAQAPFHTVLHAVGMGQQAADVSAVHVVRKGEHLSGIVQHQLQARGLPASNQAIAEGVRRLAAVNHITNPDLIYPGQVLRLENAGTDTNSAQMMLPPAVNLNLGRPPLNRAQGGMLTASDGETRWRQARGVMVVEHHRSWPVPGHVPADKAAQLAMDARIRSVGVSRLTGRGGASAAATHILENSPGAAPSLARRAADVYESVSGIIGRARQVMDSGTQGKTAASGSPWNALLDGTGYLTSDYGMRKDPFTGKMAFHQGLDIAAPHGTPIRAASHGRVAYSGWLPGYGKTVIIEHGRGTESLYGHCARLEVKKGDMVVKGTTIAAVGSTGRSTGNHLHFEVRRNGRSVNPMQQLGQQGGN